ncbi:hypothetical protein A1O1_05788 [Capronia coronata CBS 617.96]|uniref:NADAR domain-containing protein n=1 Tax=Capronia coronata CBS 617.96 TaxID=1182541 RepID=W9YT26_9EURO|nr:uncharacterized protein A1O1_05788 [Capronia coronata CBS 617.96]EXJ85424.1 hypothetical protein A1O1_05788 [Capronia coronata CBS 617.96]
MSVRPRGPAADPALLPSSHPSNPYGLSPAMFQANSLSPKVTATHVFFLGAESSDPHCCLTQWYPSPFHAPRLHSTIANEESSDYVLFPTAEHYMMYQKAIVMSDHESAAQILKHPHPSEAKQLGREVRNFDGEKWKKHAERAVEEANWAKFTQCEDLGTLLLNTGDKMLVEAR